MVATCLAWMSRPFAWHGRPAIAVDGIFGPKTRKAVVAFQKRMKLTADGIVGPNTWRKLLSPGG